MQRESVAGGMSRPTMPITLAANVENTSGIYLGSKHRMTPGLRTWLELMTALSSDLLLSSLFRTSSHSSTAKLGCHRLIERNRAAAVISTETMQRGIKKPARPSVVDLPL